MEQRANIVKCFEIGKTLTKHFTLLLKRVYDNECVYHEFLNGFGDFVMVKKA